MNPVSSYLPTCLHFVGRSHFQNATHTSKMTPLPTTTLTCHGYYKQLYDCNFFTAVSLRWTLIPPAKEEECVPYQRYGHTCVGYHNSAYIWGGRNDKDGACNILYAFDSGEENLISLKLNVQQTKVINAILIGVENIQSQRCWSNEEEFFNNLSPMK